MQTTHNKVHDSATRLQGTHMSNPEDLNYSTHIMLLLAQLLMTALTNTAKLKSK
jgi:hypothetical protein